MNPWKEKCPYPDQWSSEGRHQFKIEGTPRSAMTYYVCYCGRRFERGMGAFYDPPRGRDMVRGDLYYASDRPETSGGAES